MIEKKTREFGSVVVLLIHEHFYKWEQAFRKVSLSKNKKTREIEKHTKRGLSLMRFRANEIFVKKNFLVVKIYTVSPEF